jgi:hypothetical protein
MMHKEPNARAARLRRLDHPVVVSPFPPADFSERQDAAIRKWFAEIFETYNVDASEGHAWELLAWRLALDLFPKFEIVGREPGTGPRTQDQAAELLKLYEADKAAGKRTTMKQFVLEHAAECNAIGIKSDRALSTAFYNVRQRAKTDEASQALLVRWATTHVALGLLQATKVSVQAPAQLD